MKEESPLQCLTTVSGKTRTSLYHMETFYSKGNQRRSSSAFYDPPALSVLKARAPSRWGFLPHTDASCQFARSEAVFYRSGNQERHKGSLRPTQQTQQESKLLTLSIRRSECLYMPGSQRPRIIKFPF